MSLDVYLRVPGANVAHEGAGIFVREGGCTYELTEEQWRARYPDREPVRYTGGHDPEVVYHGNITHNLGKMALEVGRQFYTALWRPEELPDVEQPVHARDLLPILSAGYLELSRNREKYQAFNPENGWGSYDALLGFVAAYVIRCTAYPDALVEVSR